MGLYRLDITSPMSSFIRQNLRDSVLSITRRAGFHPMTGFYLLIAMRFYLRSLSKKLKRFLLIPTRFILFKGITTLTKKRSAAARDGILTASSVCTIENR